MSNLVNKFKFCPYLPPSFFLMMNHMRPYRSPRTKFTCENAELEVYSCKDCYFKTQLTFLFKQHFNKCHVLKRGSRDDLPSENFRIKNYFCEKCNFETNFSLKWLQHTLVCAETKEDFQSVSSPKENVLYSSDFKQNGEIRWYYCAECSYKCRFKRYLNYHMRNHNSNKRYACDMCSFKSKYGSNLRRHIKLIHLSEQDKWHKCEQCSFNTKIKPYLTRHINSLHLNVENVKWK